MAEKKSLAERAKAFAEATVGLPEGEKETLAQETRRSVGIEPKAPGGLLGGLYSAVQRLDDVPVAVAKAVAQGRPIREIASEGLEAVKGRREGEFGRMLIKHLPLDPLEERGEFTGKTALRTIASIAGAPSTYLSLGGLTKAGRLEKVAAPAKFFGKGRLGALQKLEKGLARGVSLQVPFTGGRVGIPLYPKALDVAGAKVARAGLDKLGAVFQKAKYTKAGQTLTEFLGNHFGAGATPEIREFREGIVDPARVEAGKKQYDDVPLFVALSKGVDTVAEDLSITAGRKVTAAEVGARAMDYAENFHRDPARFAGESPHIARLGELLRTPFEELLAYEQARGVPIQDINAHIVQTGNLQALEPKYIPRVFRPYGKKLLGLSSRQMEKVARLGPNDPKIAAIKNGDRFAKLRGFKKPDGTRYGNIELNELFKRGQAPGYPGVVATEDVIQVDPLKYGVLRMLHGREAAKSFRIAKDMAAKFGVPVGTPDHVPFRADHPILRNYWFPEAIAKEAGRTLELMEPRSGFWPLMLKGMREVNRVITEWMILPFPSTIGRNFGGGATYAIMGAGTTPADFAYATGFMLDEWRPFASAFERAHLSDDIFERLKGVLKTPELEIDPQRGLVWGKPPGGINPQARSFQGFTKDQSGMKVPTTWTPHEIGQEGYARGWFGGGWTANQVRSSVSKILRDATTPSGRKRLFALANPFGRSFIGLRPFKVLQAWADDLPKAAHATNLLRRGLTPDEVTSELARWHPGLNLSPTEERVVKDAFLFYRWNRFNIPKIFEIALKKPQLPYLVTKGYQYLTLGGEKLEEKDVPAWFERMVGVPITSKKLPDGRKIFGYTGPGGFIPFVDFPLAGSPEDMTDSLFGMLNPMVQFAADTEKVPEKDDVFLGVRMSSKLSSELRRWFRLGNTIDGMLYPKGLSQEERDFRRNAAIERYLSPLPVGVAVEGEETRRKAAVLASQMSELRRKFGRSLRNPRLQGDQDVQETRARFRTDVSEIQEKLKELQGR